MENEQLNFKFEHKDQFGQITKFEQRVNMDTFNTYDNKLELMLVEFRQFLYACGYSDISVQQVQISEDEW